MIKYFTQQDIQSILSSNSLGAQVTYMDRNIGSPDNFIVYDRFTPTGSIFADGGIHMRKIMLQILLKLQKIHLTILDLINLFMMHHNHRP